MTFFLLEALQELLQGCFSDALYASPRADQLQPPQVHIGTLPPKRSEAEECPFVLVRAVKGEDTETGAVTDIAVICGVYVDAGPPAGAHQLHNTMDRCRLALQRHRIVGKRWEREGDVTWSVGDERKDQPFPHPYYLGVIAVQYRGAMDMPPELSPDEQF